MINRRMLLGAAAAMLAGAMVGVPQAQADGELHVLNWQGYGTDEPWAVELFEQPPDTVYLEITARADTPLAAQRLADAWVLALADQVKEIEDPQGKERAGTPQVRPI